MRSAPRAGGTRRAPSKTSNSRPSSSRAGYDAPMHTQPVRAFLGLLIAASTVLVIIGLAVLVVANPVWIAFEQDRAGADVATGYSREQVRAVTSGILHDLTIGPPAFDQAVAGLAVLNDRERAHMLDVRAVFLGFGALSLLAAVTLVNGRLVSHGADWFRRSVRVGVAVLAAGVVVTGAAVAVAFDQVFEVFHRLFFAGGTYSFNPATDRLVQLFPDAFWNDTSVVLGVAILTLCLLFWRWGASRGLGQGATR